MVERVGSAAIERRRGVDTISAQMHRRARPVAPLHAVPRPGAIPSRPGIPRAPAHAPGDGPVGGGERAQIGGRCGRNPSQSQSGAQDTPLAATCAGWTASTSAPARGVPHPPPSPCGRYWHGWATTASGSGSGRGRPRLGEPRAGSHSRLRRLQRPALFVGEAQGQIEIAVPLDDNVLPQHYEPLLDYLLGA